MTTVEILLDFLKKNDFIGDKRKAKKEVTSYSVSLKKDEDLFIRDAITGLGTILCENLEEHYYITSVKVGLFNNVLTYAIIHRQSGGTTISIYAHEGLIKQCLSEKTYEKLIKTLT